MNGHIQLSEGTIDRLRELKGHGDSSDDIVRQLLEDDRNDLERAMDHPDMTPELAEILSTKLVRLEYRVETTVRINDE